MLNKEFVLAGRAIFTVHNQTTGNRYTFKVTKKDPSDHMVQALMSRKGINEDEAKAELGPSFFVNFLTGPDNESDYTYLGMLDAARGLVRLTRASGMLEKSPPIVAARWTMRQIWEQKTLAPNVTIQHAGKCCRCARTLTVPESIESGWGPECRKFAANAA